MSDYRTKRDKKILMSIIIICIIIVCILNHIKEDTTNFNMKPSIAFSNLIEDIKKEYKYVKSIHMKGNVQPFRIFIYVNIDEKKQKGDIEIKEINNKILNYAKSYDFIDYLKNQEKLGYFNSKYYDLEICFDYKTNIEDLFFPISIESFHYGKVNNDIIWVDINSYYYRKFYKYIVLEISE